jgi:hypothetical protein
MILLGLFTTLVATPILGHAQALPDGQVLLDTVLRNLPNKPVRIYGELQAKDASGQIVKRLNTEMYLDWHGRDPVARYTFRDAFGKPMEAMTIRREAQGASYTYYAGDPLTGKPTPDLFAPIQDTDANWVDLSLSFLWWQGAQTSGIETIKGRECYVVDVPAPTGTPSGAYAAVRLWIDSQTMALMKAVAYDHKAHEAKKVEAKSFKKMRDIWMIRDLEVQSLPALTKTILRVRQLQVEGETLDTGGTLTPSPP